MPNITNFINGQFIGTSNTENLDIISPHNEKIIAELCISNKEDIDICVNHAKNAFKLWSKIDVKKRIKYLDKMVDYFVIVEANITHQGKKKDWNFPDHNSAP